MSFKRRNRPKRTSPASQDCIRLLHVVFPLLVGPLVLTSFVYACLYAYIYAAEGSYTAQDWQRCLTVPNIGSLVHDHNRYCTSAANFAGQAYLALLVAVGGTQLGLRDNDLLPFSLFTALVGIVGITVYRESYPYFDVPNFMSTTLITLTKYIHPDMYDNLPDNTHLPTELKDKVPNSEICKTAYQVNQGFLCVQYAVLALAVLILGITIYAYAKRPNRGGPRVKIKGRFIVLFFAITAFCGMLIMFISKELVADIAIIVASNDQHGTTYPFTDNNLDLVSFTTLLAIGAAIYGLCKPSSMAFMLTAGVGMINATRSVPGLLGTMTGYSGVWYPVLDRSNGGGGGRFPIDIKVREEYYVLWDMDQCAAYVIQTNPVAFKNDPNALGNAHDMCHWFMGSIGGQLFTWVSILCLALTAIIILKTHPDLDKLADEEKEKQWAKSRSGRAAIRDCSRLHQPLLTDDEDDKESKEGPLDHDKHHLYQSAATTTSLEDGVVLNGHVVAES